MRKLALLCALALLASGVQAQVPATRPLPEGPQTVPLTASTAGTTAQITATLTGVAGKFTYICGFVVTSGATTTPTLGDVQISGTVTGTLHFTYVFVSSGQGLLGAALGPGCISSSATNTNIVVTVPAGGAGTTVAVTAWGYLL